MKKYSDYIKESHPEFKYFLFNENDRREYIKNNFEIEVLNAYDKLIPDAYKADLWRYCILHKEGEIYLDIKFMLEPGFNFMQLLDKEYFVLERTSTIYENYNIDLQTNIELIKHKDYLSDFDDLWESKIGIYNALIICKPQHKILLQCINKIVENVKTHFYGFNSLYPTGQINFYFLPSSIIIIIIYITRI